MARVKGTRDEEHKRWLAETGLETAYWASWKESSEFAKLVALIEKKVAGYFPEWELGMGVMTNDFKHELYLHNGGCMHERELCEWMLPFLSNYDIVLLRNDFTVDVEGSNDQGVAKLVAKMEEMGKDFLPFNDICISIEDIKKIQEWIEEDFEHKDYSLVKRLDYLRWIGGGHNCADKELHVGLRVDGKRSLFFHHEMYCGGIVFHGWADEGKYSTNGSVMIEPAFGWQQHT